jgi:hypothetical protein
MIKKQYQKQYHKNISLKNNVVNILRINYIACKNGLYKSEIETIKSTILNSSKLFSLRKINRIIKANKSLQESLVNHFSKSFGLELELSPFINYDNKPKGILYYMDVIKK